MSEQQEQRARYIADYIAKNGPEPPGTADVLLEAAKLVDSGWCRNEFITDSGGVPCVPGDKNAAFFSAGGAIWHVIQSGGKVTAEGHYRLFHAHERLRKVIGGESVALWNDRRGQTGATVANCMRIAARG